MMSASAATFAVYRSCATARCGCVRIIINVDSQRAVATWFIFANSVKLKQLRNVLTNVCHA